MVVSVNPEPNKAEFEVLLNNTVESLKKKSELDFNRYSQLLGNKLEKEVFDILTYNAKGTVFENSIELISGQRFPDIIANKFYGVEVKSTKSNHWKSVGGSIAEGTRIEGIERIFMLFGKICKPIDFICKPYEDCLSEVVVTHSPRYLIDMNLEEGETIFDKIKIPYDELRRRSNPIDPILDYYKNKLKPGESTWWSGRNLDKENNMIVRLWKKVDLAERNLYRIKGFCLFPELLNNKSDKYYRFVLWLSTQECIVCSSVRDIYSSGGQGQIRFNNNVYTKIPKIIIQLTNNLETIKETLNTFDNEYLEEYWKCHIHNGERYKTWCSLVASEAKNIIKSDFPFYDYLMEK